jgi:hypothetical protein
MPEALNSKVVLFGCRMPESTKLESRFIWMPALPAEAIAKAGCPMQDACDTNLGNGDVTIAV